jgi:hypothetical protein
MLNGRKNITPPRAQKSALHVPAFATGDEERCRTEKPVLCIIPRYGTSLFTGRSFNSRTTKSSIKYHVFLKICKRYCCCTSVFATSCHRCHRSHFRRKTNNRTAQLFHIRTCYTSHTFTVLLTATIHPREQICSCGSLFVQCNN